MKTAGRTLMFIVLPLIELYSQDLEQVVSSKPLGFSGTLNTSIVTRSSENGEGSSYWVLSASPTLSVYSIEFPFTITFSTNESRFQQPFNEYGISPKYKWLTLHAGHRSISYSPFTLAGHQFLGGAFDIAPSFLRVSGMYGRLVRSVPFDSGDVNRSSAFERWGYAGKVGFGSRSNYVDAIYFTAKDRYPSVNNSLLLNGITPAQNTVLGIISSQQFFKLITWDFEGSVSGYTRDLTAASFKDSSKIPQLFRDIITVNSSSRVSTALKSSLRLSQRYSSVELSYKRIDPGYTSLGAYYLQSDIEEFTLGPSFRLFKSRVNFNGRIGFARDDLLNTKQNETFRIIGTANLNLQPTSQFGINLNYSNSTNTRKTKIDSLADSLDIQSFVNSFGIVPTINFGDSSWNSIISLSAFGQILGSQGAQAQKTPDVFAHNYSLGYTLTHVKTSVTVTPSLSAAFMKMLSQNTTDFGGTMNLGIPLMSKKINASVSSGFNSHFENAKYISYSIPSSLDVQYLLNNKNRFTLRSYYTVTQGVDAGIGYTPQNSGDNLSLEVSYAYTF